MASQDSLIREHAAKSDIAFRSQVYNEIAHELTSLGLNLAFFVFESSQHSHAARKAADGSHLSCPVVKIYFKYDEDFKETRINAHQGNWDDKWEMTIPIRNAINKVLNRNELGSGFISEQTFVFVQSFEEIAFRRIGRDCKGQVWTLVAAEVPGAAVTQVFWNGKRFDAIFQDKKTCKWATRHAKKTIDAALPGLFQKFDTDRCCKSYPVTIEFGHEGMNLFPLIHADC
jgi:hypothetical protein